jgi:hypothetical protein
VTLAVQPRPSGPELRVEAAPYTFAVLGTRFEVERTPVIVELRVSEGRVAVHRAGALLEVVGAGGRWRGLVVPRVGPAGAPGRGQLPDRGRLIDGSASAGGARALASPAGATTEAGAHARPLPIATAPATAAASPPGPPAASALPAARPPPAPAAAPAAPAPAPAPAPSCEALVDRGAIDEAVSCHLRRADGGGLAGELSLFKAGRLRRDRLGDASGALAAFRSYRARFPRGALRAEVDLAIAGLLPRLGRYDEALQEIAGLLATPAGRERTGELELLRGNVLREGLGDCARAERAYEAAAATATGDRADDARLYRAACLEILDRRAEAAAIYRWLTARPGKHAGEARARLERLGAGRR